MKRYIHIGGASILLEYILSHKSKEEFVENNIHILSGMCEEEKVKSFLSAFWEEANKDKDFAVKSNISEATVAVEHKKYKVKGDKVKKVRLDRSQREKRE